MSLQRTPDVIAHPLWAQVTTHCTTQCPVESATDTLYCVADRHLLTHTHTEIRKLCGRVINHEHLISMAMFLLCVCVWVADVPLRTVRASWGDYTVVHHHHHRHLCQPLTQQHHDQAESNKLVDWVLNVRRFASLDARPSATLAATFSTDAME